MAIPRRLGAAPFCNNGGIMEGLISSIYKLVWIFFLIIIISLMVG